MKVALLLCAAGASLSIAPSHASAQVNWETRVRYLINGVPTTSLQVQDGPVNITLQAGIFNLTGQGANQANHGLNMWSGIINSTATGLAVNGATARIAPYNYGPASSFGGAVNGPGTAIGSSGSPIYTARAIAPTENVAWPLGQAEPTGPAEYGIESYVSVYQFTFNMSSAAGSGTTITAIGNGGPVLRWLPFSESPPDAGNPNGSVNFLGLSPTPVQLPIIPATLTLTRVPSPGAGAALLLGLAPLATRRRRNG